VGTQGAHTSTRTRTLRRPCPVCWTQHRRQHSARQGPQLGWRRLQGRCARGGAPCHSALQQPSRLLRRTQRACPRHRLHDTGLRQLAAGVECSLGHLVPGLHSPQFRPRSRAAKASLARSQHVTVCRQLSGVVCGCCRGGGASGRGVGLAQLRSPAPVLKLAARATAQAQSAARTVSATLRRCLRAGVDRVAGQAAAGDEGGAGQAVYSRKQPLPTRRPATRRLLGRAGRLVVVVVVVAPGRDAQMCGRNWRGGRDNQAALSPTGRCVTAPSTAQHHPWGPHHRTQASKAGTRCPQRGGDAQRRRAHGAAEARTLVGTPTLERGARTERQRPAGQPRPAWGRRSHRLRALRHGVALARRRAVSRRKCHRGLLWATTCARVGVVHALHWYWVHVCYSGDK
jgi:hypothetical protein